MSKAGLEMLTKCLALEIASSGVRVNAVSAGTTDTNFMRYAGLSEGDYNSFRSRVASKTPLKKISSPEEIAKAVIFLCSERYKGINKYK